VHVDSSHWLCGSYFSNCVSQPIIAPNKCFFFPSLEKKRKGKMHKRFKHLNEILFDFLVALYNHLSYLGAWRKVLTALYIIIHE
jgi:hypothetical protein